MRARVSVRDMVRVRVRDMARASGRGHRSMRRATMDATSRSFRGARCGLVSDLGRH